MLWAPAIDYGCRFGHHFWRWWQASGERFVKNCPTPSDGRSCVRSGKFIEPTPQGGQTAHHGGDVCGLFCVGRRPQYCTIPTLQNLLSRIFFVPAQILINVKLSILNTVKEPLVVPFRRGSLRWIGKIHRSVAVGRATSSQLWWCFLVSCVDCRSYHREPTGRRLSFPLKPIVVKLLITVEHVAKTPWTWTNNRKKRLTVIIALS